MVTKYGSEWVSTSSEEYINKANTISRALLLLGVKANDKIAIISTTNRTEWNILDFGISQIGAINIPIYPTISKEDYEYIFNHAEITHCFLSDQELLEKAVAIQKNVSTLKDIYSFDEIENCKNWQEVLDLGSDKSNQKEVDTIKNTIKSSDLATIIYTSGTTGRPKGVMLNHANVLSNLMSVSHIMSPPVGTSKVLSFLPLCHIFERTASFCFVYMGYSIYYAENMETIGDNLKEVQPHLFNTVPRLLEKVYDKIVAKGYELTGVKKKLFFWALELGLRNDPAADMGGWYDFQLKIANKLIFSKWREALGGNIQQINSGASALQPRLARVFWAAGIRVCEGYGLTETSPVVTASIGTKEEIRIGYVGKIVKDVEVKIAEDGEILVKGPNIMQGYYKEPEMTADVIKDGWFHTGDIGVLEGRYLKITDRKKEMFKTSGGKYIAPQPMENKFKESPLIEQLIVVGADRNYPAALIVPSFDGLKEFCKRSDVAYTTDAEMIQNEQVQEKYLSEVAKFNELFGNWEQIKRFELLDAPWGIETGELTPTMKLKRKVIMEKYADRVEALYRK